MTKNELIGAVADRLCVSRKDAAPYVDAIVDTIQITVAKGEKVAITGFGSWEKTDRPAREARNPATGATIKVPATSVPKFKAGADFKSQVAGLREVAA
jgi:DNA-binding protein HU-beta